MHDYKPGDCVAYRDSECVTMDGGDRINCGIVTAIEHGGTLVIDPRGYVEFDCRGVMQTVGATDRYAMPPTQRRDVVSPYCIEGMWTKELAAFLVRASDKRAEYNRNANRNSEAWRSAKEVFDKHGIWMSSFKRDSDGTAKVSVHLSDLPRLTRGIEALGDDDV